MENEIRTLRTHLRRMQFVAPGMTRVACRGADSACFAAAVEAEGLCVDSENPEGFLVWSPDESLAEATPPGNATRVVIVVAAGLATPPLPYPLAGRPARISTTLRDWVKLWPAASLLRPFLEPDAVGSRKCNVRLSGNTEWLFVDKLNASSDKFSSGPMREAAVTFLSSGYFPIMPATLASALLVPPALIVHFFLGGIAFQAIALLVATAATLGCVFLERWAANWFLAEDPREFVLDEVAGMAFTWALLPPDSSWTLLLLAFFLFRIFDIFKWGISWIEALPVRGKIVWDDLLAGLYAGVGCILLGYFLP